MNRRRGKLTRGNWTSAEASLERSMPGHHARRGARGAGRKMSVTSVAGAGSSGMRSVPVIDVEGIRTRLARRFGPEVPGWCAGLPDLVDDLAGQWGFRLGESWPKGGALAVLPCES